MEFNIPNQGELCIRITQDLEIGFYCSNVFFEIGNIDQSGKCYFLTKENQHKSWEIWKKEGFKIFSTIDPIKWNNLFWMITHRGSLRIFQEPYSSVNGLVFNFIHKYSGYVIFGDGFLQTDGNNRILYF